jgi:hypothetical protein
VVETRLKKLDVGKTILAWRNLAKFSEIVADPGDDLTNPKKMKSNEKVKIQ